MLSRLDKAEEQLRELDRLCFFGCEEYNELKQAAAEYKQRSAGK